LRGAGNSRLSDKESIMATTFERVSDSGSTAGAATQITLNDLGFFSLSAVRTAAGRLKLIGWRTGDTVARLGDSGNQAGKASYITISRFSSSRYVTAVQADNGLLKLIAFDVDPSGAVTRTGDSGSQAGAISEVALVTPSSNKLVTAVRDGAERLKVINWNMRG
jgi:hypothetical protein